MSLIDIVGELYKKKERSNYISWENNNVQKALQRILLCLLLLAVTLFAISLIDGMTTEHSARITDLAFQDLSALAGMRVQIFGSKE